MIRVFVSLSHNDMALVEPAVAAVGQRAIDFYFACHDPQPGVGLGDKLKAEIAKSDVLLAFLTPDAYGCVNVQHEIACANTLDMRVVLVVHRDVRGRDLGFLGGREYVTFDPDDVPSSLAELRRALEYVVADHAAKRRAVAHAQAAEQRTREVQTLVAIGLVLFGAWIIGQSGSP